MIADDQTFSDYMLYLIYLTWQSHGWLWIIQTLVAKMYFDASTHANNGQIPRMARLPWYVNKRNAQPISLSVTFWSSMQSLDRIGWELKAHIASKQTYFELYKVLVIARHALGRFVNVNRWALLRHAFNHKLNSSCNLWGSVLCPQQIWRESVQRWARA
jgi:hypothetical protein